MCCSIYYYYECEILLKAVNNYKCIIPKYDGFLNENHTFLDRTEERSEQGTLGGLIFEPPLPRRFKNQTSSSLRARNQLNPKPIFLHIKKPALKT